MDHDPQLLVEGFKVTGFHGYSSIRSKEPIQIFNKSTFFEVEILDPLEPSFPGVKPAIRIGISVTKNSIRDPVGINSKSIGYSSLGKIMAERSIVTDEAPPYEKGDIIGVGFLQKPHKPIFDEKDKAQKMLSEGICLKFYKNGEIVREIFSDEAEDLSERTYHFTASFYMSARAELNFGDKPFKHFKNEGEPDDNDMEIN